MRTARARMPVELVAFGLVALGAIACGPAPASHRAPDTADLIVDNARVFTGDPARPWTDALAIRGDRVVALGADARHMIPRRRIDAGGKLVIPGINDAHVHQPVLFDPFDASAGHQSRTLDDLLGSVRDAVASQPAGAWIRADLGVEALDDAGLTRDALDAIAPVHPLWIDNDTGHVVVMNSAAERALGLSTSPPPGGFIDRPGWRSEYARYEAMRKRAAAATDADITDAVRAFEDEATRLGITTVQALPLDVDAERLVRVLAATPRRVRWHVIRVPIGGVITPKQAAPPDPSVRVTLAGTKYFLDGMQVERGAALSAPYTDARGLMPRAPRVRNDDPAPAVGGRDVPATGGRLDWDRASVHRMLEAARASGDALHVHAVGDRALALLLDVMVELGGDWRTSRVVIEHGDGLSTADLRTVRELGVVVVQNPFHSELWSLDETRLGERRKTWMKMKSIIAAGIPLALGSDGPLNPFWNIELAARHLANVDEALTREQALVAYTQGAAFDERAEAFKGRLVPGMVADLAVLTQDLLAVDSSKLPETRSVLTIVGGEIVYELSPASGPARVRTE